MDDTPPGIVVVGDYCLLGDRCIRRIAAAGSAASGARSKRSAVCPSEHDHMSPEIELDLQAQHDITALPATALPALAEAMTVLELTPWNGRPINPNNPDGAVRTLAFGSAGMLTYLVLDDVQRVDVLIVARAS